MTIALISDIHGNFEALTAVLDEIDSLGVKNIICLGDVVGYYSQVNECCEELLRRKVPCVMGNHDWYLVSESFCPRSQSVNDCLSYQRTIIRSEYVEWIKSFPVYREYNGIKALHGGWTNPIDEYLEPSEDYFEKVKGDLFVSGHTHRQSIHKFTSGTYCNPGSVGQPRDGDHRAAFAVFHNGEFLPMRVEYDIDRVGALMEQAGFSEYYYGGLFTGASRLTLKSTIGL
jgi:putative phosphoesterase